MEKDFEITFKFEKPWYRTTKVLDILEMSISTLKRYKLEHIENGGDPRDMGCFSIDGFREEMWDPQRLLSWILEHKIKPPKQYDYEVREEQKLKGTIVKLNNNKEKKLNAEKRKIAT